MGKTALIFLADGSEEIEFTTTYDVLGTCSSLPVCAHVHGCA